MTKHYSFEFFPPKTDIGAEKLHDVCRRLAVLKPGFFSVTYGAGGSTRERSLGTVLDIQKNSGCAAAPHLSCIGDSREELGELLDIYRQNGIRNIVALRGDLPSGMGASAGELAYAADLVHFIRDTTGDHFHIEVAAYPECHPQAPNMAAVLEHFLH